MRYLVRRAAQWRTHRGPRPGNSLKYDFNAPPDALVVKPCSKYSTVPLRPKHKTFTLLPILYHLTNVIQLNLTNFYVEPCACPCRHSLMSERRRCCGMRALLSRTSPVSGEVSLCASQPSIAARS